MTLLRTDRLALAPVDAADADELLALFNDPEVGRYLLDGVPVSREWVEDEIVASDDRFDTSSAGLWAVRRHERPDVIIGIAGFRPFFDPPELQLLYALHPDVWGQGLATEAGHAAMEFAFGVLGFDEVRAATDGPNEPSIRVLERLGMERWRSEPGTPWETLFYRIRSSSWR